MGGFAPPMVRVLGVFLRLPIPKAFPPFIVTFFRRLPLSSPHMTRLMHDQPAQTAASSSSSIHFTSVLYVSAVMYRTEVISPSVSLVWGDVRNCWTVPTVPAVPNSSVQFRAVAAMLTTPPHTPPLSVIYQYNGQGKCLRHRPRHSASLHSPLCRIGD